MTLSSLPPPPVHSGAGIHFPHIQAKWTYFKEAPAIKGHAKEIVPGNQVTVMSSRPGFDGSRLSLQTIGRIEDVGSDPRTGEPMRIGWPVR